MVCLFLFLAPAISSFSLSCFSINSSLVSPLGHLYSVLIPFSVVDLRNFDYYALISPVLLSGHLDLHPNPGLPAFNNPLSSRLSSRPPCCLPYSWSFCLYPFWYIQQILFVNFWVRFFRDCPYVSCLVFGSLSRLVLEGLFYLVFPVVWTVFLADVAMLCLIFQPAVECSAYIALYRLPSQLRIQLLVKSHQLLCKSTFGRDNAWSNCFGAVGAKYQKWVNILCSSWFLTMIRSVCKSTL